MNKLFPFGNNTSIYVVVLTSQGISDRFTTVCSQPATEVYVQEVINDPFQFAVFIFKWLSAAVNFIYIPQVTLVVNDGVKTIVLGPFLPYGDPVASYHGFTIDGDMPILRGIVKKDVGSAFYEGSVELP